MAGRKLSADEQRYRTQDDLQILQRAAEIQKDRTRMTAVQKHALDQVKSLQKVVTPTAKKRGK